MQFDVVGIGGLCLDLIVSTVRIPQTDGMMPLLSVICQGGGKVPTAMVALSRLGASGTMFCTVGDDRAGRFCLKELTDTGVNTDYMTVLKNTATNLSIGIAEAETGGRSFIGKYDMPGVEPKDLDREVIQNARYLHVWKFGDAERQAISWIHEAGGEVVCDADRYSPALENGISLTDVFICSEFFFEKMFGEGSTEKFLEEGLQKIAARGPKIAIVTLGARGYAGVDADGFFAGDAFSVPVVDSTGAGDVFHGAYIYGLLQGWDARQTARFASAVSAVKCTALGGRTGIPDRKTVDHFLETGEIDRTGIEYWQMYYRTNGFL